MKSLVIPATLSPKLYSQLSNFAGVLIKEEKLFCRVLITDSVVKPLLNLQGKVLSSQGKEKQIYLIPHS